MGFYPNEGDVDANGAEEVNLRDAAGAELVGQKTSSASLPVVIASDQSVVPVTDSALTSGAQKTQIVNGSGLVVGARDINSTPVNGDIGVITNSIIYGHTTAGGGAYVEVKVNPSGALTTETDLTKIGGNAVTQGQKTMASSVPVVIASDQSTVPVAVGLPTFLDKTFGYAVSINQPTASTDNPLILIKNPNASGKTVYFSLVMYGISVSNVFGVFRAYRNPTITANGTAQTVVQFGGASTVVSLFTTPTISANGTLLATGVYGQNSSSFVNQVDFQVQVAANSNLLITGAPSSNNRAAEITVRWIEV